MRKEVRKEATKTVTISTIVKAVMFNEFVKESQV